MKQNEERMLALVSRLAEVKSEQNILAALAIYHEDIELISPSFKSSAKGSIEAQQQLEIFFSLFPDYKVSLDQYAVNKQLMLATGQVSLSANIPGKKCPSIILPVFIEFHFQAERIIKEVFHLDAGLICEQSGIKPDDLQQAISKFISWKQQVPTYA